MADDQQRADAIEQMVAITAAEDDIGRRSCEELLRASDWNIERAIDLHYTATSTGSVRRQASPSRPSPERSASAGSYPPSPPSNRNHSTPIVARIGLGTIYGIFLPVRFVLRVLLGIWFVLAKSIIPNSILNILPRLLTPPPAMGRLPLPSARTKPFVQSLREDYTSSPLESDQILDFYPGPYKEFLRSIRADPKLGVVILCCAEHEDDEVFKRDVLLNAELGRTFREKNIAVWGGDVREREAYQVAQTLQITTYPSLTFFSLLPPATGSTTSSSVGSAKLTVLTTVSGSPSTTTSLPSILHLLDSTLIPRSQPFLARVKRERRALEESRKVREDQDRRAQESARRDHDRIMASRREREQRERREREESEAVQRVQREKEQAATLAKKYKDDLLAWRRYQRRRFREMDDISSDMVKTGQAVRIQIKLPTSNGMNRNIRIFSKDPQSLVEIFRWTESLLLGNGSEAELKMDPSSSPSGFVDPYTAERTGLSIPTPVRLFTSYPRKEVELGVDAAWDIISQGGGSLVAEVAREDERNDESDFETDDDDE